MTRPAACLFDLDGLLLDTEPLHGQAWQQAARHFGADLSRQQLLQLRGRRRLDCAEQVRQWMDAAALPVPSVQALLAVRQPIAEALMLQAPPIDGARSLLERCSALQIPMALATSSSSAAVAHKSTPHPWLALITMRVHGDDPELGAGKPAPDVFLLAAARLQVDARQCWAFEDSPAGATAAVRAGCRVHVLPPAGLTPADYPSEVIWLDSLNDVRL
ncbi:MAG: hypothetical protein RLZZ624_1207 [Cyanobacteriota bacterium]|jgi:HAD superfamily hydrolase (TIGR01509 family)